MPARKVTVFITGDAKGLDAALAGSAAEADAAAAGIGDRFDAAGTKVGNTFERVGQKLEGLGIPGAGVFNKIGGRIDEANTKGKGFGETLSTIGGVSLLAGAAGVAAFGVESIKLASTFQSTVASIASSAGISVTAAKKIGSAFLDTAGTTIYSAQEIAGAYKTVAGQLGQVEGHALDSQQAMQVMSAAMDLAEGSGTNLGAATKALATVMQIYGIKAAGAKDASDQLFESAMRSGNTVPAVADAVNKLHTQLGVLTPPLAQTGALLVDLATHGEKGSRGLRSVSTALGALLKPTQAQAAAQADLNSVTKELTPRLASLAQQVTAGTITTTQLSKATKGLTTTQATLWSKFTAAHGAVSKATQAITEHGLKVTDATGKLRSMGTIIGQLHDKIAGLGKVQGEATLAQYVGTKGAQMLYSTVAAGEPAYNKATKAVQTADAAHKAAEKQAQTLAHQMDLLKATVEDEAVKFGSFLIPKLEAVAKVGVKVIDFFVHSKPAAIALGVAIGGPLLAAVAKFTYDMGTSAVEAVGKFGRSLAHPIEALKGTASAEDQASARADAYQESLDTLNATIGELTDKLALEKTAVGEEADAKAKATQVTLDFQKAMRSSTEALAAASEAEADLQAKSEALDEALATLTGSLEKVGTTAEGAGGELEGFGAAAEAAAPEVEGAAEGMGAAVDSAFGPIGLAIIAVTVIVGLMVSHWKETEKVLKAVWDGLKAAGEAVWHALDHAWHAVLDATKKVWDEIKSHLAEVGKAILLVLIGPIGDLVVLLVTHWKQVKADAVKAWDDVLSFLEGIPAKILGAFAGAATLLVNVGRDILRGLWDGAKAVWTDVTGWVGSLGHKIMDVLKDAGTWLIGIGGDILKGLLHGIEDGVGAVLDGIKSVGSKIVGAFKSVLSIFSPSRKTYEMGDMLMQGLAGGVADNAHKAVDAMAAVGHQLATKPFVLPPITQATALSGGASGTLSAFGAASVGYTPGAPSSGSSAAAATALGHRQQIINVQMESQATPHKVGSAVAWAIKTAGD